MPASTGCASTSSTRLTRRHSTTGWQHKDGERNALVRDRFWPRSFHGRMNETELMIIDVFICKLREKLANASQGKNYIGIVWGRGYVPREDAPAMRAL